MECVRLSRIDLIISRVGFGCEPLGGADWGYVDESDAVAAVSRALDLGINFFDTADVYGLGRSEEILSRALGERRKDVVIATKFGVNWHKGPTTGRARTFFDCSPRRTIEALEGSLRRLQVDCIPLYLVHWPDPKTPIGETMQALMKCREEGKIRHIGVSNFPASQIREAHQAADLSAVELPYNLIDRRCEAEVLPLCRELGLAVIAHGPLAQGLLTGKYDLNSRFGQDDRRHRLPHFQGKALVEHLRIVDRLKEVGERHQRSPAQVAIRWLLDYTSVTCAITGAKSPPQIEDNVGAVGWSLAQDECRYLADGVRTS